MRRPCTLPLVLLSLSLACAARQEASSSPEPAPTLQPAATVGVAPVVERRASEPAPPWRVRTAIAVGELQASDPALYHKLLTLRPNRRVGDELFFAQPELDDPRAAAVLLKRLLNGDDPVGVRLAVVDALPVTGGDWQEGAAALVGVDASPRVRKKLVEVLRYVAPPHNLDGLRLGFRDEDPAVRVAAARTCGFARDDVALYTELISATLDEDWDMRAAAVQALGQLEVVQAQGRLVRMLADENPAVRLQVLIALERIDPAGIRQLPEVERLARDRQHWKVAQVAERLLRERPPTLVASSAGAGTQTGAP